MRVKTAMILAAGRGERLRPLTDTTPKPLIQVGDHTLIEYHLLALAGGGYRDVVINLAHLGEQIQDCLGDGSRYGLAIRYSHEKQGALETAGGIHHALPLLGEAPFLVINGDIRCDIDFAGLKLPENASMHLVMVPNPPQHPDGDFSMGSGPEGSGPEGSGSDGLVLDGPDPVAELLQIQDKAVEGGSIRRTFSGIGIYRPEVFADLLPGRSALAPLIRNQIAVGKVTAELFDGYWIDVGTPQRLEEARQRAALTG